MSDNNNNILELLSKIDDNKLHNAISAPSKVTDPMYTIADVKDAPDVLTQIVRYLFLYNNISKSKFREMHKRYCNRCGFLSTDATTKFNNNLRTLMDKRITWRTLTEDVLPVLGLMLIDVELVLTDDNRVIRKVKLSDLMKKISDAFPADIPNLKEIAVTVKDDTDQITTIKQENFNGKTPGVSDNQGT